MAGIPSTTRLSAGVMTAAGCCDPRTSGTRMETAAPANVLIVLTPLVICRLNPGLAGNPNQAVVLRTFAEQMIDPGERGCRRKIGRSVCTFSIHVDAPLFDVPARRALRRHELEVHQRVG